MARSASRPIAPWATCRRRCATIWCGSAGATATTRSSRPSRRSTGSTSTASAARRRASTSPSSTTSTATTCARGRRRAARRARIRDLLGPARRRRREAAQLDAGRGWDQLANGPARLKERAKTLVELAEGAAFLFARAAAGARRQGAPSCSTPTRGRCWPGSSAARGGPGLDGRGARSGGPRVRRGRRARSSARSPSRCGPR